MIRRLLQLVLVLGLGSQAGLAWGAGTPAHQPSPAATTVQHPAVVPSDTTDPQTTFSLANDREPITSLNGQWRFQPGDDPAWADPHLDDSKWALVKSGSDWDEIGYHYLDGPAWYRFRITLPVGEETYSLRLPVIYTCYQVFVDGRLLLTEGKLPPDPGTFRTRPVVVDLPSPGLRSAPKTLTVALRIWHDPMWSRYRHGGLQGEALVGRKDLIDTLFTAQEQAHLWQYSDELDLGGLELLAFTVALVLYLTRRSELEFLWFATLVGARSADHFMQAWSRFHTNNVRIVDNVDNVFQALFLVGALLFFLALFRGKWSHAFTFVLSCCGLYALTFPLSTVGAFSISVENAFALLFQIPVFLWIYLFIRRQAKRGEPDARILRFPVLFLLLSLVYSRVIWTLQTAGLTWFSNFEIHWRDPFYVTLDDLAEGIFLLAMLAILLRRFASRSREQDRVESELEAARSVQQVLVPETLPRIPGLAISTAYHPAQEVGGDFFQILPLPSGTTLIVIGDVAGKGLPAALQVSLCVGTLRALAECNESPAEILAGLNRSLQGRGPGFTTCLALSISPDRAVLTFANAGHIPPYVNGFELRQDGNLPLGLVLDASFEEVRYALSPGDHLTVLTDGVPEAMHQRELFGFERTVLLSRQPASHIAEAARAFGQTDDITVLTLDIVGVPASHTEQLQPALQPA